ncbi:hypothetical protein ACFVSU_02635 [Microbacterium sp. NPDC058062]|uniref:hypothetical protein n=1 Tax=Microbacterium sp. NPDC058062 TaxID=3346320 RepID=UPI0036D7F365
MSIEQFRPGKAETDALLEWTEASGLSEIMGSLLTTVGSSMTPKERMAWSIVEAIANHSLQAPQDRELDIPELLRGVGFFRANDELGILNGVDTVLRVISFADTRPREPVTLFRAAAPGRERRMHWSSQLTVVIDYAQNKLPLSAGTPNLYSCQVPGDSVLAILPHDEWIVDTDGLEIVDHGPVQGTWRSVQPEHVTVFGR